jgi:argininosuccinate lyase
MKGLPMTYTRDMQEDKEPVFDAVDTVRQSLTVFAAMLREARCKADNCARAVSDPTLLATDLADYLVNRGVPFRQAHEIIGRAVALAVARGCALPELTLDDYRALSPAFEQNLFDVFRLENAMRARQGIGAPSPANIASQIARWQKALAS